ncbi:hypothetical protein PMI04_012365 [Sphingobium sp. AP49]|uniref:hypothetical protein n=1 Tax=Sphingobium sp. AP49 TaxID=1144307 RepID=UPI00026ED522|nr:hypothetical protein [Sphingobium sp. AP49]WHO37365.1 hypothetical protein PMI04_012365 [Sphingobium sp. AP49]
MRNRVLVLTNEGARHPFRQRLPRHVFQVVEDKPARRRRWRADPVSDDNDWKLFVLSFSAFFTAFYSFIF